MDVQSISIALAGIGIFIAAINSIISSRKADQQRQIELFTTIYEPFLTERFIRNWAQLRMRKQAPDPERFEQMKHTNMDIYVQEMTIDNLIGYTCFVINSGLIDIDLVDDILINKIIQHWERNEHLVQQEREYFQDPTAYNDMEAVYNVLKQRHPQRLVFAQKARELA